jgi:hypothetical protein
LAFHRCNLLGNRTDTFEIAPLSVDCNVTLAACFFSSSFAFSVQFLTSTGSIDFWLFGRNKRINSFLPCNRAQTALEADRASRDEDHYFSVIVFGFFVRMTCNVCSLYAPYRPGQPRRSQRKERSKIFDFEILMTTIPNFHSSMISWFTYYFSDHNYFTFQCLGAGDLSIATFLLFLIYVFSNHGKWIATEIVKRISSVSTAELHDLTLFPVMKIGRCFSFHYDDFLIRHCRCMSSGTTLVTNDGNSINACCFLNDFVPIRDFASTRAVLSQLSPPFSAFVIP